MVKKFWPKSVKKEVILSLSSNCQTCSNCLGLQEPKGKGNKDNDNILALSGRPVPNKRLRSINREERGLQCNLCNLFNVNSTGSLRTQTYFRLLCHAAGVLQIRLCSQAITRGVLAQYHEPEAHDIKVPITQNLFFA